MIQRKRKRRDTLLRSLRKEKGLQVKQVAKVVGIHPHELSEIERCVRACGELNARRLGEFYGVDWRLLKNKSERLS